MRTLAVLTAIAAILALYPVIIRPLALAMSGY